MLIVILLQALVGKLWSLSMGLWINSSPRWIQVHLAHSTCTDLVDDAVMRQSGVGFEFLIHFSFGALADTAACRRNNLFCIQGIVS